MNTVENNQVSDTAALDGKFANHEVDNKNSIRDFLAISWAYLTEKHEDTVPKKPIPVQSITNEQLEVENDDVVYRLGHSSILMKLDGQWILTDPVFSDRASPVQWAGPKRFHQPPISIQDLPTIDVVLISHDHYDHLDKAAVKSLAKKVDHFLVPSKVGALLQKWGVPASKIQEFLWWDSANRGSVEFAFTPTQHFSGRSLTDRNQTLWGSWVIRSSKKSIFFSGDSGYFSGFKEIGNKYGPFDLTMIETGAYNKLWSEVHMFPRQSLQAHIDLKGKMMMPIHNSTFDLSMHRWYEPLEKASNLARSLGVTLVTPVIGQRMSLNESFQSVRWWEQLEVEMEAEPSVQNCFNSAS
ncbi:L-ascorbate metabolism protein UlaG (beta-lactamase superfamily) [Vibrio diazotrophicus]|uniref:L-ascorbate metabolism protein UlaG (Beta-lactamase superfamily) n=1 Tax=Vibrio diazotrophicus TaxID=685 RepID=A0A329EB61_VIBDI|nr:MBL fold metallo-hydrolase [Vibrio diazotrophicus]RAS66387.1 L-ascorbate metabolism protein UlaG (beta-lactamase superfamily) [Vibrio diazotrophicus]